MASPVFQNSKSADAKSKMPQSTTRATVEAAEPVSGELRRPPALRAERAPLKTACPPALTIFTPLFSYLLFLFSAIARTDTRHSRKRAPRKIGATHAAPQNCRQMIPLRSRFDSLTFTPELHAIGIESNFSRCPKKGYFAIFPDSLMTNFCDTPRSEKGGSYFRKFSDTFVLSPEKRVPDLKIPPGYFSRFGIGAAPITPRHLGKDRA
jgi:hypothetical protein